MPSVDAGELRCRCYGNAISAHTATRGLFTGIGLWHVAARSVGMIAGFRLVDALLHQSSRGTPPDEAVSGGNDSLYCFNFLTQR
jgi:hypothetical protein